MCRRAARLCRGSAPRVIVDACGKAGMAGAVEVCVIGSPDGCVEELQDFVEEVHLE